MPSIIDRKMKRKAEDVHPSSGTSGAVQRAWTSYTVVSRFRDGLFASAELDEYTKSYASSAPDVVRPAHIMRLVLLSKYYTQIQARGHLSVDCSNPTRIRP